jgi:hypothetical protein
VDYSQNVEEVQLGAMKIMLAHHVAVQIDGSRHLWKISFAHEASISEGLQHLNYLSELMLGASPTAQAQVKILAWAHLVSKDIIVLTEVDRDWALCRPGDEWDAHNSADDIP